MSVQIPVLGTIRIFALLCLIVGSLISIAEAAELEAGLRPVQNLTRLSDLDLGLAYLWAQQEEQKLHDSTESDRFSGQVRRFLFEAKDEIQKRGSTQIAAVYDGIVSPACPRDSFVSGYAKIEQNGAEWLGVCCLPRGKKALRYYFNVKNSRTFQDNTGYLFAGPLEAIDYAKTIATELAKKPDLQNSFLEVTDEDGREIAKVPVA
jgi:hypothetical protein